MEYKEKDEIGYNEKILIQDLEKVIQERIDFYGYSSKEFIDKLKEIVERIE